MPRIGNRPYLNWGWDGTVPRDVVAQHAMARLSQVPLVPALPEAHPRPPLSVLPGVEVLRLQDVRRRLRPRQSNGRKYEVRSVGGISVSHAQSPEGEDLSFIFNNPLVCHKVPGVTSLYLLSVTGFSLATGESISAPVSRFSVEKRTRPRTPPKSCPSIWISVSRSPRPSV